MLDRGFEALPGASLDDLFPWDDKTWEVRNDPERLSKLIEERQEEQYRLDPEISPNSIPSDCEPIYTEEEYRQFLEDTVDDAEYNAWLDHIHTPRAEEY